jgi:hypothetical protein
MFDRIRALYDAGCTVREIANSSVLVTDASIAECVALTCRNATPWCRSPVQGLFRGFPGTELGAGNDQGPPLVLWHTPSWLTGFIQPPGAFPRSLAQPAAPPTPIATLHMDEGPRPSSNEGINVSIYSLDWLNRIFMIVRRLPSLFVMRSGGIC